MLTQQKDSYSPLPKLSETEVLEKLKSDFDFFFHFGFSVGVHRVDGNFMPSQHFHEWCYRLQHCERTATISARHHCKSTVALGYVAWRMLKLDRSYVEGEYMSYREDLAAYQLKKLRRYIAALPELFGDYDLFTQAEGVVRFFKDRMEFICEPSGILSFKRGRHPHFLIADDILRDPTTTLDLSQIQKITSIFLTEVESMPSGSLHVLGTPQDQDDLFTVLESKEVYDSSRYPAISDYAAKSVLWQEKYPYEKLLEIKQTIGEKAFNKEYLCRPARQEEAFLREENLITWSRLKNFDIARPPKLNKETFAGFDIGKKTHPSHLSIFGIDRKNRLIQVASIFLDGWSYVDQLEYLREAIKKFSISQLCFDATRGEFESFDESGILPGEMLGVNFSLKQKFSMAAELDKFLTEKKIILLSEERLKRQLLSVDNNLQAPETGDGHGDCFWSICLAIEAYREGTSVRVWDLK